MYSIDEATLPDDDLLRAEIDAWLTANQAEIDAAKAGDGVSQFASKTIQKAEHVPVKVKQAFNENPYLRSYKADTNADQLDRAMGKVNRNGYAEEVERLLNADSYTLDDSVEAGALTIAAFVSTFLG